MVKYEYKARSHKGCEDDQILELHEGKVEENAIKSFEKFEDQERESQNIEITKMCYIAD